MSLRISSGQNSNVTFPGKYSRPAAVKTSDSTAPYSVTIAAHNWHQHLATPLGLEVTVLCLAPMRESLYTEKRARNRLFAAGVER